MAKNGQKELIRLYKHLSHSESADFRNENLADFVVSKMKKGSLLDAGCGSGLAVIKASQKGHFPAVGLDIEGTLIRMADESRKKHRVKADFKKLSITGLKGKIKEKFDNVISLDVIEHVKDDELSLNNLNWVTKKGGRLIIAVPAHPFLYGKKDRSIGHFRRYTKGEIVKKIRNAGFRIDQVQYWNFLGFFVYFVYEKIFGRVVTESIRYRPKSALHKLFQKLVFLWVKYVENRIVFPIGLSIIVVATKK